MNTQILTLLTEARAAASTGRGRRIREAAGLSQGEIARAAGVSAATVSRWEAQLMKPSGQQAIRYARVLRLIDQPTNEEQIAA